MTELSTIGRVNEANATATFATSASYRDAVANVAVVAVATSQRFPRSDVLSLARAELFEVKGVQPSEIYDLVTRLRMRDRESDDRRMCFECRNFAGVGPWACKSKLGLPGLLPADLPLLLQRCDGFDTLNVEAIFGVDQSTCINKERADE